VYIHTLVQEVPPDKGKMVLKTLHGYKHSTSIFDDFIHYEKRQEEDEGRRVPPSQVSVSVFWVRKIFYGSGSSDPIPKSGSYPFPSDC
jgi:hypothetical protein